MPSKTGYETLDAAAIAARDHIRSLKGSDKREYIGLLYQDPKNGQYFFTEPQTQAGTEAAGKSRGTFSIPKGSARGIIHNHPRGGNDKQRHLLSPGDIDMSRQLGIPSYVGVDDQLHIWDPNDGKIRGTGRRTVGVTMPVHEHEGDPIGNIADEAVKKKQTLAEFLAPRPDGPMTPVSGNRRRLTPY